MFSLALWLCLNPPQEPHLPSRTSGNDREGERCAGFKCEEKSGRWNLHKRLQSLLGERLPEGWQAAFDMECVLV